MYILRIHPVLVGITIASGVGTTTAFLVIVIGIVLAIAGTVSTIITGDLEFSFTLNIIIPTTAKKTISATPKVDRVMSQTGGRLPTARSFPTSRFDSLCAKQIITFQARFAVIYCNPISYLIGLLPTCVDERGV
jgi:hypothetical protein